MRESGFAYGRSETSSDSEQIEHTVARQHVRNSVSVENERAKSASGSVLVYCERCDKQIQDGIKGEGRGFCFSPIGEEINSY